MMCMIRTLQDQSFQFPSPHTPPCQQEICQSERRKAKMQDPPHPMIKKCVKINMNNMEHMLGLGLSPYLNSFNYDCARLLQFHHACTLVLIKIPSCQCNVQFGSGLQFVVVIFNCLLHKGENQVPLHVTLAWRFTMCHRIKSYHEGKPC